MPESMQDLDAMVNQVRKLEKYRHISPDLIRTLLQVELTKRSNPKEAIKAARSKLHQVGTAYLEAAPPFADWQNELSTLPANLDDPAVRAYLLTRLPAHASTRERLSILPDFFNTCLAGVENIHSVLDVACGLTPLTLPWMPLQPGFTYTACDILTDLIDFLQGFFNHFEINGHAIVADALRDLPPVHADLTLLLKTIPCLEQMDKDAGRRLLHEIPSPNLLVSFPARSLGGHPKGMVKFYEQHFFDLIQGQPWQVTRFEFPGELVFRIQK
ncbi:MAG: 16S rRNA methyltransferase [Anaerolineaceae bacterium]